MSHYTPSPEASLERIADALDRIADRLAGGRPQSGDADTATPFDPDLPPPITLRGEETVEVVMTDGLFRDYQALLRARGLYLFPIPTFTPDQDRLPAYGVGIGQRLIDTHPFNQATGGPA